MPTPHVVSVVKFRLAHSARDFCLGGRLLYVLPWCLGVSRLLILPNFLVRGVVGPGCGAW